MEAFARRVRAHLEIAKSYTVVGNDLEPILPNEKAHNRQRVRSIQAFAKKNGWSVTILDPGIRVTFRNLAV